MCVYGGYVCLKRGKKDKDFYWGLTCSTRSKKKVHVHMEDRRYDNVLESFYLT